MPTPAAPIIEKAAALNPTLIATTCSPRHIQTVIEDSQTAIVRLGTVLQAVLNEVKGPAAPYSNDSYLPAHLIEMMRSALGYPEQS